MLACKYATSKQQQPRTATLPSLPIVIISKWQNNLKAACTRCDPTSKKCWIRLVEGTALCTSRPVGVSPVPILVQVLFWSLVTSTVEEFLPCCRLWTGTGKTRIAQELILERKEDASSRSQIAAFLAPTVPLAKQVPTCGPGTNMHRGGGQFSTYMHPLVLSNQSACAIELAYSFDGRPPAPLQCSFATAAQQCEVLQAAGLRARLFTADAGLGYGKDASHEAWQQEVQDSMDVLVATPEAFLNLLSHAYIKVYMTGCAYAPPP